MNTQDIITAMRAAVGSSAWLGVMVLVLDAIARRSSGSVYDAANATVDPRPISLHFLPLCGLLCGLMLCECSANPVPATGEQQSEQRQSAAPPASATGQPQKDAAKSNNNATPRRDAFEALKLLLGHVRVQLAIMAIAGFSIGYTVGKWRSERETGRKRVGS